MQKFRVALVLVIMILAGVLSISYADESEVFTCTAYSTSNPQARSRIKLTINIDEFTSDDEIIEYIGVLNSGGQEKLKLALEKVDKGWIQPRGEVRETFNFARSRPVQDGRFIGIVSSRDFRNVDYGASAKRSREFRYTFIYLKLDEKGEGSGYMFPGTRVQFDPEGHLVLEQIGADAVTLSRVKLKK